MGTNYYAVRNGPSIQRPIHIGKSSCGWKFHFQAQNETWNDPPVIWNTFNQVKEWLKKYTVDSNEYVIMNEYDEIVTLDWFLDMVEKKQKEENTDNYTWCKNVDDYRFDDTEFS